MIRPERKFRNVTSDLKCVSKCYLAPFSRSQTLQAAHDLLTSANAELLRTSAGQDETITRLKHEMAEADERHQAMLAQVKPSGETASKMREKLVESEVLNERLEEAEAEIGVLQEARADLEDKRKKLEAVGFPK